MIPPSCERFRNAVNGLDALKLHLEDADLTSAALSVEALADAVDEQADVLDSRAGEISTDLLIETLDDQAKAMKDVNRAVAPAVVEMGRWVFAHNRTAWVGYNANYRHVQLLFEGLPIPQQDNYLAKARV